MHTTIDQGLNFFLMTCFESHFSYFLVLYEKKSISSQASHICLRAHVLVCLHACSPLFWPKIRKVSSRLMKRCFFKEQLKVSILYYLPILKRIRTCMAAPVPILLFQLDPAPAVSRPVVVARSHAFVVMDGARAGLWIALVTALDANRVVTVFSAIWMRWCNIVHWSEAGRQWHRNPTRIA